MKTPEEIKKLFERCKQDTLALIEQLERERDEAVAELKGYGCTYCKYLMRPSKHKCGKKCVDFCNWEWCGVKMETQK